MVIQWAETGSLSPEFKPRLCPLPAELATRGACYSDLENGVNNSSLDESHMITVQKREMERGLLLIDSQQRQGH
jgi:hypothetical protein